MQAYNSDLYLTTTETAELLDVHPSSVKRWCDAGELESDRTEGGHRRIYLRTALDFADERDSPTFLAPFAPFESHVWLAVRAAESQDDFRRIRSLAMGWLVRGYPQRITALFEMLSRRPTLTYERVCDEAIRPFMAEVGEAWHAGRLRIGDEHLAGQAILDALFRLTPGVMLETGNGTHRVAVVGSAEGDQHQIGSMCVRVLLEREGWRVLYLGPNTPAEEFANVQRTQGAELVCVSFTPPASTGQVRRALEVLMEFYESEAPYHVAIGGSAAGKAAIEGLEREGARPPFLTVQSFAGMEDFAAWLRAGERHGMNGGRPDAVAAGADPGSGRGQDDDTDEREAAWRGTGTQ